jgi:peptidoglycan hydrolase-like protein with peptidoglycan-binding domain
MSDDGTRSMLHDSALLTQVQQKLAAEGIYQGPTDGKSSPELAAAIREYQAKQGLEQTGAIDHKTADALGLEWSKFDSDSKTIGDTLRGAAGELENKAEGVRQDVESGLKHGASEVEKGANKAAAEIQDTARDAEKKLDEQTR